VPFASLAMITGATAVGLKNSARVAINKCKQFNKKGIDDVIIEPRDIGSLCKDTKRLLTYIPQLNTIEQIPQLINKVCKHPNWNNIKYKFTPNTIPTVTATAKTPVTAPAQTPVTASAQTPATASAQTPVG
jgi:hypothetical protein